jgi:phosphate transport system permease protein
MSFDSDSINKKRQRNDKWSRYVVTGFGGLVLLTLVILITHLISQALPLAYTPTVSKVASYTINSDQQILQPGDVTNDQPLLVKKQTCRLGLNILNGNELQDQDEYIRPCDYELSTLSLMGENFIVDVSPNAQVRITPVRNVNLEADLARENDLSSAMLTSAITFALPQDKWQQRQQWRIALSVKWVIIAIETEGELWVRWINRQRPTSVIDRLFTDAKQYLLLPGSESILVHQNDSLMLNHLRDENSDLVHATTQGAIAFSEEMLLFALEKQRTFFLFNPLNRLLSRWVIVRDDRGTRFEKTYEIMLNGNEGVKDIAEHASMNLLAVLTTKQRLLLVNRVSGEMVNAQPLTSPANVLSWYGDKLYGTTDKTLTIWQGNNLSGITTWSSLFQPQHYEGYDGENTVWQTTSASDYQEAKFSLTPLLIGSIKASFLALLIAIPVAIGAAIYTAFFAKSKLRNAIKPAIELLEAIPSVLIGFIAAIWLSPKAEQFLFSFGFFLIVIPFVLIGVAVVQRPFAELLPKRLRHGAELFFALCGVFILGYISVEYAPSLVFSLLGLDGFALLAAESESPIGKTTIVVALALGVAITPSIYSLAEDAIYGVPNDLKYASFALGATRLQTLLHVVVHVALPGIVAAIMLGFGRAFGETMIVLMVTGNTPISSWGLIEGLRALTANLAIELPEADVSSAHYQILFFTACILFAFTFVVNTLAELMRQRIKGRVFIG